MLLTFSDDYGSEKGDNRIACSLQIVPRLLLTYGNSGLASPDKGGLHRKMVDCLIDCFLLLPKGLCLVLIIITQNTFGSFD